MRRVVVDVALGERHVLGDELRGDGVAVLLRAALLLDARRAGLLRAAVREGLVGRVELVLDGRAALGVVAVGLVLLRELLAAPRAAARAVRAVLLARLVLGLLVLERVDAAGLLRRGEGEDVLVAAELDGRLLDDARAAARARLRRGLGDALLLAPRVRRDGLLRRGDLGHDLVVAVDVLGLGVVVVLLDADLVVVARGVVGIVDDLVVAERVRVGLAQLLAPLEQHAEVALAQDLQVLAAGPDLGRRRLVLANGVGRAVEDDRGPLREDLRGVRVAQELERRHRRHDEQPRVVVGVALALALLLARLRVEHAERLRVVQTAAELAEDVLRVQELRVDLLGREVARAHHEDLRGLRARRRGLRRADALEQAPEGPRQRVVVLAAVDLRDEGPAAAQTALDAALERQQRDLVLDEGVLVVGRADVRRAVAKHDVDVAARAALAVVVAELGEGLPRLALHVLVRRVHGDVADDGPHVRDRPDGKQVDGDDGRAAARGLGRDLGPAAGRRAEVEDDARLRADDVELLVDVRELEGRARPVALLLGEHVPLVVAVHVLALLQARRHGRGSGAARGTRATRREAVGLGRRLRRCLYRLIGKSCFVPAPCSFARVLRRCLCVTRSVQLSPAAQQCA